MLSFSFIPQTGVQTQSHQSIRPFAPKVLNCKLLSVGNFLILGLQWGLNLIDFNLNFGLKLFVAILGADTAVKLIVQIKFCHLNDEFTSNLDLYLYSTPESAPLKDLVKHECQLHPAFVAASNEEFIRQSFWFFDFLIQERMRYGEVRYCIRFCPSTGTQLQCNFVNADSDQRLFVIVSITFLSPGHDS